MSNVTQQKDDSKPNFLLVFWNGFRPEQKASMCFSLSLLFSLGAITFIVPPYFLIIRALSVGGLGGLVHEFAQSGGKIMFLKKFDDGLYLGSFAGTILGAVAGLLVIQGYIPQPDISQSPSINTTTNGPQEKLASNSKSVSTGTYLEIFFAGLGLKGVIEAAGGTKQPGTLTEKTNDNDTHVAS